GSTGISVSQPYWYVKVKSTKKCKICSIIDISENFPHNRRKCKECYSKQKKEIYLKNKESISEKSKYNYKFGDGKEKITLYYKNNRGKILDRKKKYRERNKNIIRKYDSEYRKKRKQNDIKFRIMSNFRSVINIRLRNR